MPCNIQIDSSNAALIFKLSKPLRCVNAKYLKGKRQYYLAIIPVSANFLNIPTQVKHTYIQWKIWVQFVIISKMKNLVIDLIFILPLFNISSTRFFFVQLSSISARIFSKLHLPIFPAVFLILFHILSGTTLALLSYILLVT